VFDRVFVPLDPGNGGLAVGTALRISDSAPRTLTPFLGPSYSIDEIKETLDNCKLQYSLMSQDEAIEVTIQALLKGRLVGWFQGPMEWGPRTLGGRSILANPFAPYVLDNLNHFLKHRQSWRGYAMSGPEAAVADHFDGPASAPFMESDYRPRDRTRFRHALPSADAAVRVHSVAGDEPAHFRTLLEEFGRRAGSPFLINTSFNGFQEPIVCSPRDAIRVFFGSGLDVLILDRFILTK
jgi:carbamoyltransferase